MTATFAKRSQTRVSMQVHTAATVEYQARHAAALDASVWPLHALLQLDTNGTGLHFDQASAIWQVARHHESADLSTVHNLFFYDSFKKRRTRAPDPQFNCSFEDAKAMAVEARLQGPAAGAAQSESAGIADTFQARQHAATHGALQFRERDSAEEVPLDSDSAPDKDPVDAQEGAHPLVCAQRLMDAWGRDEGLAEPDLTFVAHLTHANRITLMANYTVETLEECFHTEVPTAFGRACLDRMSC